LRLKIINVVGARPNFMKIAPLMEAYRDVPQIEPVLLHTGQHYDAAMSDLFFRELGIPEPEINLGVGSGSHAQQVAQVMVAFEAVLKQHRPQAVLVVGDVNSTIACGLVAVKLGVKLVHVEAGLRSFDRTMPEEINRVLTDAISDLLFCTEQSGVDNLRREGIAEDKVFLVGNLMIDTLLKNRERAYRSQILQRLSLEPKRYAVLTLHRPSNVDDVEVFDGLMNAIEQVQRELQVVFPMHPRTRSRLNESHLGARLAAMSNVKPVDPLGYMDFLKLMAEAKLVLTDSGGIQEETTILGVPCLTLRENTERPATVDCGSNVLVGTNPQRIIDAFSRLKGPVNGDRGVPPLWDGGAAKRVVRILVERLGQWGLLSGARF
jgi:UDP-N-acetylglucosamine 2-epimerase (non-hydrolysing)